MKLHGAFGERLILVDDALARKAEWRVAVGIPALPQLCSSVPVESHYRYPKADPMVPQYGALIRNDEEPTIAIQERGAHTSDPFKEGKGPSWGPRKTIGIEQANSLNLRG